MSPNTTGDGGSGTKLTKAEMNPKATYGGGGAPACSKVITIRITVKGFVNHRQGVSPGQCVQWRDQTGQSRDLDFNQNWPFFQAWQRISVPANGLSNVFLVAQVPAGAYPYLPDPKLPVGPPDPPAVVVGG